MDTKHKPTAQRHEDIAQSAGLNATTGRRFVSYMRARWPEQESEHCLTGYALEWALRFKHGDEYAASDSEGQAALRIIDSMRE